MVSVVFDGPKVNTKRVVPSPREHVFDRLRRSTSYATRVAPRQLATDRGRGRNLVGGPTA